MSERQEQAWVEAWNNLFDLLEANRNIALLLPDWSEISLDEMQEWIQQAAYSNKSVSFAWVWHKGRKALQVAIRG